MDFEHLMNKDLNRLRKSIIAYDGDINKTVIFDDGYDLNYLHICVSIDSPNRDEALKFLLTRSDLNVNQPSGPSNNCWTALHIVAFAGFADTLDLLLRNRGDPYLSDVNDLNVWDVASVRGNHSCIEILELFANSSLISTSKFLFNKFKSFYISDNKKNKITNHDLFSMDSLAKVESDESDCNSSQETIIYVPKIPEKNCETKIYVDNNARLTFVERKQSIDLNENSNINVEVDELSCSMIVAKREKLGLSPVPVTPTTRSVYAKQLRALEKNPLSPSPIKRSSKYSEELESFIEEQDEVKTKRLEQQFREYFNNSKGSKDCFTYILIDPRVTKNLQSYTTGVQYNKKLFNRFLRSIFYIGKGKKRRPMEHLVDARNQPLLQKKSEKLDRITDIWSSGRGVVSLHCFQNISSDEALSREFCMLAAIKNENVTNIKTGDISKLKGLKWNDHKKKFYGASLLQKAYFNLLIEGEREIKPADIKK